LISRRSDGIVLRRRHVMLNNSFETLADVKLQPGGQGTQVHVTLRSNYLVAAFITLWLGFAIVFNIVIFASGTARLGDLVLTLFFPVFGFGFLAFGRLLAQGDRAALMEFVGHVTGGRLTE
jgi:hypothetical protein